ncbi:MAG TPA: heavy-metal-associated domain-containing protein [Leptolyngbyaceae cyanobacterium M65_K2018_010]|nr:heavy-metal-associated domain-containing protein [Leptolyngbyaceae cyanobacterium M65_K2018_010]
MTLDLTIPDLACSACVETVTKAVRAIDAGAEILADTQTKQVTIVTYASEVAIKDAITAAGYTVA